MVNTQSNYAESKFADLLLDQVEAVLAQDPCEDSLYDLLKIASPNIDRYTVTRDHQKHFKKLKFQVHPDRHTRNSERANKIFQSMADFYEQALASSKSGYAKKEKRQNQYPVHFRSSEKWEYIRVQGKSRTMPKDKSVGSIVAMRCIVARGSIAHGKKIETIDRSTFERKDKDERSVTEVFEMFGGFKVLSSPDEIKAELMTHGPVVSTSFELSSAFLSSIEGRDNFFHVGRKGKVQKS